MRQCTVLERLVGENPLLLVDYGAHVLPVDGLAQVVVERHIQDFHSGVDRGSITTTAKNPHCRLPL